MKTIIRLTLFVTAALVAAVVFRVSSTVIFEGIAKDQFALDGTPGYEYQAEGSEIRSYICGLIEANPESQVTAESRTYENGDILKWKLEGSDRVFTYQIAFDARFLSGLSFSWVVKDAGPCPLESL